PEPPRRSQLRRATLREPPPTQRAQSARRRGSMRREPSHRCRWPPLSAALGRPCSSPLTPLSEDPLLFHPVGPVRQTDTFSRCSSSGAVVTLRRPARGVPRAKSPTDGHASREPAPRSGALGADAPSRGVPVL